MPQKFAVPWTGLDWSGLVTGRDWSGLVWTGHRAGLVWTGLDWSPGGTGLDGGDRETGHFATQKPPASISTIRGRNRSQFAQRRIGPEKL